MTEIKHKTEVYIDGAARGNPGEAGIGVVIKEGRKTLLEVGSYIGKATNNIAEYMALIRGLEEVLLIKKESAKFISDSELLVKQLNGEYRVKNEGLLPLYLHAKELIKKLKHFEITHAYREANKHADKLANRGIDEKPLKDSPLFQR
jgi:ribonuclease HI